jgi:hypothetical protein
VADLFAALARGSFEDVLHVTEQLVRLSFKFFK